MASKSQRILNQMGLVSLLAVITLTAVLILKFGTVMAWAMGDFRPLVLNGIIFVLFLLGTLQLFKAIRHFQLQENQIHEYVQRRQAGVAVRRLLKDSMCLSGRCPKSPGTAPDADNEARSRCTSCVWPPGQDPGRPPP